MCNNVWDAIVPLALNSCVWLCDSCVKLMYMHQKSNLAMPKSTILSNIWLQCQIRHLVSSYNNLHVWQTLCVVIFRFGNLHILQLSCVKHILCMLFKIHCAHIDVSNLSNALA